MPKRRHFTEDQVREIETSRRKNKNKKIDNRLRALLLHAEGMKHRDIAGKTELAETYIGELVTKYLKGGISAVAENSYAGNRRNLTFLEEKELLDSFVEKAKLGQIVEISQIKRSYEAKIGRELKSRGHIYQILKRHGWRKVMPRSKHPNKASDEVIEASKKLTQSSEARW